MNTDIRLSVGFWQHPKTKKTVKRLGLEGIRSLQILWLWAAVNRPDGFLSGMDWEDVELAADWQGEEGAFLKCCDGMWLDQTETGFALHDWSEHNPWQAEAEVRSERARNNAKSGWEKRKGTQPHQSGNAPSEQKQCNGNAAAMQPHQSGNAPSPSPSPEESKGINTPPYPPEGGKSDGESPPTSPAPKSKAREPTGNSLPELRQAMADYTTSEPLRKTLEDFRLMRERIRKPMTGQALCLLFRELEKLAGNDDALKIAVLEQSILNSWQGVFALKGPVRAGQVLSKNMETTAAVLAARQQRRQGP